MAYKQLKLWFDKDLAQLLSSKIIQVNPDFNSKKFIRNVDKGVDQLELKDRIELISDELFFNLREDYIFGISTLINVLGPENLEDTGMFSNYYWVMPIAKFVEKYGLQEFSVSMQVIEEITKRNTGEYCIRPFIINDPTRTMKQMQKWSKSINFHVRRLSSEGGRPRLPWAAKLQMFIDDPTPLLPILDRLKDDNSKYVQKSVANCLHDILKDNPDIGKVLIDSWLGTKSQNTKWIIKHSLRTLIKKQDSWSINIIKESIES